MPNLEQEIARMMANDGVYIVSDSTLPRHPLTNGFVCTVFFVSGGTLWSMKADVPCDPNRFFETAVIKGPFRP